MPKRKRTKRQERIYFKYAQFKDRQVVTTQNFVLNQLNKVGFKSNKGYRYNIIIDEKNPMVINGKIIDSKLKRRFIFTYIRVLKDVVVTVEDIRM